jgi:hypothetical protein
VLSLVVLLGTIGAGCISTRDLNRSLGAIVKPYAFSSLRWEIKTLLASTRTEVKAASDEVKTVTDHFAVVERTRELKREVAAITNGNQPGDAGALKDEISRLQVQTSTSENGVAQILQKQLGSAISGLGIHNPFERLTRLKFGFPPLDFRLERPPHLLVISPRDRIESLREVTLRQNLTSDEMAGIEAEADKLGVASLVLELGGFSGTYPTFVTNEAGLRFTLDAAAEEWLHQYLAFKPLGIMYLLDLTGLRRNYEIATMNETVASMAAKEIGSNILVKYYPDSKEEERKPDKPGFDFNKEMREIRKVVDSLLAEGKVEAAEKFMAEKRQYLAANGHYLRKLNQAYFAFYGTYADRPDSISPIGAEMRQLRAKSASLKEFLETAATLQSRQDLLESLK